MAFVAYIISRICAGFVVTCDDNMLSKEFQDRSGQAHSAYGVRVLFSEFSLLFIIMIYFFSSQDFINR